MFNLQQIIQQIQRDLYCPVCGKDYRVGEIKIKGLFDHTLVIQTVCPNGHIAIFVTNFKDNSSRDQSPITNNEVLDLHNALKKFNGDFEKIWSK